MTKHAPAGRRIGIRTHVTTLARTSGDGWLGLVSAGAVEMGHLPGAAPVLLGTIVALVLIVAF
jgi:hypothetical protein